MSISAQLDRIMPRSAVPVLRPYQVKALQMLRVEMARLIKENRRKRSILVSSTGTGKTLMASDLIRGAVVKGSRVLFTAPRIDLVGQTSEKLDKFGVDHGVIMSDHPRWRPHAPVQVASRDTLARRLEKPGFKDTVGVFDIIVVDECQTALGATMEKILAAWPGAMVLGLTATPVRGDGKSLSHVFESLVVATTVPEMIRQKYLVPISGFVYDMPDTSMYRSSVEYTAEQQEVIMQETVLGGSVLNDYQRDAAGLRALVFCVNQAHARAMLEQAQVRGIPAEIVTDETPVELRKNIYARVTRGETLLLINVFVLTIGTDIPALQCMIDLCPTKSDGRQIQKLGRILRPYCFTCRDAPKDSCHARNHGGMTNHDVKQTARIHDHAGNLVTLNLTRYGTDHPDGDVDWTHALEEWRDKPKREAPTRVCPACKGIISAQCRTCPLCNEPLEEIRGIVTKVTEDAGRQRLSLEELRKRRPPGSMNLTDAELRKVHAATRDEKLSEYLRLRNVQVSKGLKEGFVWHKFKEIFGHGPKFTDEELAEGVPALRSFIPYKRDRQ